MSKAFVLDMIKKLSSLNGIDISLLIKKNGDIIASSGNDGYTSLEPFGIMSATIFGAANTANDHLNKETPEIIILKSSDGDTIIKEVGNDFILVIRSEIADETERYIKNMDKAIENLEDNIGGRL